MSFARQLEPESRFHHWTNVARAPSPAKSCSSAHQEYWIPAADVPKFNESIVGPIELIHEFRGCSGE
jgi:hypothetical protein